MDKFKRNKQMLPSGPNTQETFDAFFLATRRMTVMKLLLTT